MALPPKSSVSTNFTIAAKSISKERREKRTHDSYPNMENTLCQEGCGTYALSEGKRVAKQQVNKKTKQPVLVLPGSAPILLFFFLIFLEELLRLFPKGRKKKRFSSNWEFLEQEEKIGRGGT